jgi:hypothetical protein
MLTVKRVSDLRVIFALGLESRAAKVTRHRIRYNLDRLDELESVHRLFDGVAVEHRAPRRPNPLHSGRRVVNRISLSGNELSPIFKAVPNCEIRYDETFSFEIPSFLAASKASVWGDLSRYLTLLPSFRVIERTISSSQVIIGRCFPVRRRFLARRGRFDGDTL